MCAVELEDHRRESALNSTKDPVAQVDQLNELADQRYRHEPEVSLALLQEAEELALAANYTDGFANSQIQKLHIYHITGDFPAALALANQLLNDDESIISEQYLARIRRRAAMLHAELGDYARALNYLQHSLKQHTTWGDHVNQAHTHLKIGNTYSLSGDPEQALTHYAACVDLFIAQEDDFYTAIVYNSYCVDYTKLGDFAQAYHYGQLAHELFEKLGDLFGLALIESSLGEVAVAEGNFAVAAECFARSLVAFAANSKSPDSIEILETRLNLGQALNEIGDHDPARQHVEAVLTLAEENNLRPLAMRAHQLLAQAFEADGKSRQALDHLKQYVALREEIFNENSQRELQNLKVLHQTEQARAELDQQRRLREQDRLHFQRLSQIKDEFVHNVTHDIKNPLSVIETSMHLLKERFLSQEPAAQRILNTINRQLSKILALVGEMLELAKLEAVPELQLEQIALTPWLHQLVDVVHPLAEKKQIDIQVKVEPAKLQFYGDRQRLTQAIENLLSNAVKYTMATGRITLLAYQQEDQLILQIQDSGVGIPAHAHERIFDRFYRVEDTSDDHQGTGLGLNVVKVAIEQHGGTIAVTSDVGHGATFTIQLPFLIR